MHRYVLIAVLMFALGSASASAQTPSVSVSFNHLTHPRNHLGFMHGAVGAYWNKSSNQAVEERAGLLSPVIWRGAEAAWSMNTKIVSGLGATPIYTLSSVWQAAVANPKAKCMDLFWNRPMPYQNWPAWEAWVKAQATKLASLRPQGDIWVDIWNEPDHPKFWPVIRRDRCYSKTIVDSDGSKWLKTFLVTERLLRSQLGPRAKIIGPSVAGGAMDWSSRLINYCAKNHCRVDALAWHICGGGQKAINQIVPYARRAKRLMRSNRNWRSVLGINGRILMTEYTSRSLHLRPGALVAYWYALERSPISASALANWNDPDGSKLAGMLTPQGLPKPLWWTARAYAVGLKSRVSSSTNNGFWSLLASRQGITGGPEFMLGNNYSKNARVKISLRGLSGLGFRHKIRLGTIALPRSGSAMVILPRPRWSSWITIKKDTANTSLATHTGATLLVSVNGA